MIYNDDSNNSFEFGNVKKRKLSAGFFKNNIYVKPLKKI